MNKIATLLSLTLMISVLTITSALALSPNHPYTVQLQRVSDSGQQLLVEQMNATSDANGKLNFQFSNVPDIDSTPYLMVQIMDNVDGQLHLVRQNMVPAPTTGQQMQMGVSEISHRQTQAALSAMQSGNGDAVLRVMFPLTMISSGAISDADADTLGMMADDAGMAFETYMTQANVGAAEMAAFRTELLTAMRSLTAACKLAVDETDPVLAANRRGEADGLFMQAMIEAGADAGIDPEQMAAAFDQARLTMEETAPGALSLPQGAYAMFDGTFMAGQQLRQVQAQIRHYTDAMVMFSTDISQLHTFTAARDALHQAMLLARQDYQQIFADPTNQPDQLTIDAAQTAFDVAMQSAMDAFASATTATDQQVGTMLSQMATQMGGVMLGGGIMSGSDLMGMGFGQMMLVPGGTAQNWTTMMLTASSLPADVPALDYVPATSTLFLELESLQSSPNLPVEPDWTALPNDANLSLLQLQFDLMLAHMIEQQMLTNLGMPPSVQNRVLFNDQHLTDQATIRQGLQGLTAGQERALMSAMSPIHQL